MIFVLFSLLLLELSLNDYFYYCCSLLGTDRGSDKLPGLHQVVFHRQNVMSFDSLTLISAYVQYLMCLSDLMSQQQQRSLQAPCVVDLADWVRLHDCPA